MRAQFPNLEKPNFGGDSEPAQSVEGVKPPAAAISLAGKGMPLLSPIFNLEADLQAKAFNFGSYDEAEIIADIQSTISSAPRRYIPKDAATRCSSWSSRARAAASAACASKGARSVALRLATLQGVASSNSSAGVAAPRDRSRFCSPS